MHLFNFGVDIKPQLLLRDVQIHEVLLSNKGTVLTYTDGFTCSFNRLEFVETQKIYTAVRHLEKKLTRYKSVWKTDTF